MARHKIAHQDHDNYYPVVNDLATLTWLAQLAALEIHVPQWRFGHNGQPRNPDRLVLDLDPGPGVSLADCAEIALLVRDILRDIGHDPVPVTSGSKGIHLYAPLDGSQSTEQASAVARELALALEADHPDRVISSMKRSERDGKVFIDWSQNNGAKTTVAPYSLRGRDHPIVAAPRTWEELESADLHQLTYEEVLDRIAERAIRWLRWADPEALGGSDRDRLAQYRSMRDAAKTPEPVPASSAAVTGPMMTGGPASSSRSTTPAGCTTTSGWSATGCWSAGRCPRRRRPIPRSTTSPCRPKTIRWSTAPSRAPSRKGEYGGGEVRIWDSGTYELHKWREGKEVIVTLFGQPDGGLGGVRKFALIHTGSGDSQPEKNWLMHLMKTDPRATSPPPPRPRAASPTDPVEFPDHVEPDAGHPDRSRSTSATRTAGPSR